MMAINHHDLWDTNHLKSALAAHTISEGKAFAYFFAIMGFDWLQFTAIRLSPVSGALLNWEYVDVLLTFFLTLLGMPFLFWCNGGVRGKDFLYRYFPLSFVVGWKFMVFSYAALSLLYFVMQGASPSLTGWASTIVLAAINVAMALRIGFHMRALSFSSAE